jgi:hypothetical protein
LHLGKNLREAVAALRHNPRPALQAAAALTGQALTGVAGPGATPRRDRGRHPGSQAWPPRQATAQQPRHAAWGPPYEALQTLPAPGTPDPARAQQRGLSRPTV